MTISKERFEQLALEVWNNGATEYDDREGDLIITDFAHALIKRVEAESEIEEHLYTYVDDYGRTISDISVDRQGREYTAVPLIALPLVSEE